MMSPQTMTGEELLRTHLETLSRGDLDAAVALYSEDAILHYPGRGPLSRDYRGRDEIRSFFAQIGERTGGSFSATHEALFSGEGQAAVLVSLVAERNGERHEWKAVDVIRVEDGLIAYHRIFEGDQYSLDEWWS